MPAAYTSALSVQVLDFESFGPSHPTRLPPMRFLFRPAVCLRTSFRSPRKIPTGSPLLSRRTGRSPSAGFGRGLGMLRARRTSWREPMPGAPKKAAGANPRRLLVKATGSDQSTVTMKLASTDCPMPVLPPLGPRSPSGKPSYLRPLRHYRDRRVTGRDVCQTVTVATVSSCAFSPSVDQHVTQGHRCLRSGNRLRTRPSSPSVHPGSGDNTGAMALFTRRSVHGQLVAIDVDPPSSIAVILTINASEVAISGDRVGQIVNSSAILTSIHGVHRR